MKVLLNVRSLGTVPSGIGTYTFQLRLGLTGHGRIDALSLFGQGSEDRELGLMPRLIRKSLRPIPQAYEFRDRLTAHRLRRSDMARNGFLYHEPNYVAVPYDGPCVITVSDLSHLRYPQFHPRGRVRWLNRNLVRSVSQAGQVICYSEYIRDEVVDLLGTSPDKLNVVYPGVSELYHQRTAEELRPVLERYGLHDQRYVLSVGTLEPRKNLIGLIKAYSRLPAELRRAHPLVMAGPLGWHTGPIEEAMRPLVQEGSVRWLGCVTTEELAHLYAGAHMFAYLSFYEGFGLPLIEAMASGTPVLTSNTSAMPEVAGDAALLADPTDTEAIARGLRQLLQDDALRAQIAKRGVERARQFTWEKCVNETISVYEQATSATAA